MKLMTRQDYEVWIAAIPDNECVFCLPDQYPQIVLKETANWYWIVALAPYWKYHTMIIPKRHYSDIHELPDKELIEMIELYKYAHHKLLKTDLRYDDGTPVYQYIYFWRVRDRTKNKGNIHKPSHFHLHLTPDRDGLLDPAMDLKANQMMIDMLMS